MSTRCNRCNRIYPLNLHTRENSKLPQKTVTTVTTPLTRGNAEKCNHFNLQLLETP